MRPPGSGSSPPGRGVLLIHTLSHDQLRNVFTLKFLPEALALDLSRYPPVSEVVNALGHVGFDSIETMVLRNTRTFRREELVAYLSTRANSALRILHEHRRPAAYAAMVADAVCRIPQEPVLDEPHDSTLIAGRRT